MLKFKINKDILNSNSPKKVKKEIEHIKRALSKDLNWFKEIPEEFLLLEDDDILQYAFKMGLTIEKVPQKLFKNIAVRNRIIHQNIIQQGNITDTINVLKVKGRGDKEIIKILSESAKDLISQNVRLFNQLLTYLGTKTSLQFIIDEFFSSEQLSKMFEEQDLPDRVERVREIYENYPTMLNHINSKFLLPQYQKISLNKLQLIVRINETKTALTMMNNYELELYTRMSNSVSEGTNGWNEIENNILLNFREDAYNELINDLIEKSKSDQKMTKEELEMLTSLFSGYSVNFESGNTFNITKREELRNFEYIKNLTCDTILKNPQLDNENDIKSVDKYLKKFTNLSETDRIKMAILEKYYNLTLKEAESITRTFADGIADIETENEEEINTIEIIRNIKNICECNNIDSLSQIKDMQYQMLDLSQSVLLRQNIKNIYQRLYKDTLYQIDEKDRIDDMYYKGTQIPIYYPGESFAMVVKKVIPIDLPETSYEETWNKLDVPLRFRTSVSYMTPENLLDLKGMYPQVIFGFGENESYSIDEIYEKDAVSPFLFGDKLFTDEYESKYEKPSNLEANTYGGYNEMVINTLFQDKDGKIKKIKPSYIVYIQENQEEDKENNRLWEASLRAARDFRIPIVVLDREKIQQQQIEQIVEKFLHNGKVDDRLIKQIYHYVQRYGTDALEGTIPTEIIEKATQNIDNITDYQRVGEK